MNDDSEDMSADDLVARAEDCPAFNQFSQKFDTWSVQCWLGPREKALHFGIGAFSPGAANLLEVGTLEGASALFTLAGIDFRGAGTLYSVDPHFGAPPFLGSAPWQFTFRKFQENIRRAGFERHVRSFVSDSQMASSVWPAIELDSVLVDGDHSYEGCLRDIECWSPKLRLGGLLLFDDADDPALPELLRLLEELKGISGLQYEGKVEGVAVFRRRVSDGFALLEELKSLASARARRPWDMAFVHDLSPRPEYDAHAPKGVGNDLLTAYQLGFLARCEPGDYGIAADAPATDVAVIDALIAARRDGGKIVLRDPPSPYARFRMIVCGVEEAKAYAALLLPGGVLIARSGKPATHQDAIGENRLLLDAGLDGCGWLDRIHWGFARPHFPSMDAIVGYVGQLMSPVAP